MGKTKKSKTPKTRKARTKNQVSKPRKCCRTSTTAKSNYGALNERNRLVPMSSYNPNDLEEINYIDFGEIKKDGHTIPLYVKVDQSFPKDIGLSRAHRTFQEFVDGMRGLNSYTNELFGRGRENDFLKFLLSQLSKLGAVELSEIIKTIKNIHDAVKSLTEQQIDEIKSTQTDEMAIKLWEEYLALDVTANETSQETAENAAEIQETSASVANQTTQVNANPEKRENQSISTMPNVIAMIEKICNAQEKSEIIALSQSEEIPDLAFGYKELSEVLRMFYKQSPVSNKERLKYIYGFLYIYIFDEMDFWNMFYHIVDALLRSHSFNCDCGTHGIDPLILAEHVVLMGISFEEIICNGIAKTLGNDLEQYKECFIPEVAKPIREKIIAYFTSDDFKAIVKMTEHLTGNYING